MLRTKVIGRQPTDHGAYNPSTSYGKKFIVTLFDCGWESKHDNNTSAPATLNAQTGTITENTTDWKKKWGSYKQWLIDNGYQKMDATNVKDGNNNQHQINASFANEIGSDSTPESIKGRITNLEEAVGSGGSVDERIAEEGARHYLKNETYTKEEVNGMITTPNQEYVSVEATEQTTAATDVLPATGEADTIYRVANWDGSQYDTTCYTEYTWNTTTSAYVKLSTKNVGIDDEPTAGSDDLVKSGGVAAELIDIKGYNIEKSLANIEINSFYTLDIPLIAGKTYNITPVFNGISNIVLYPYYNKDTETYFYLSSGSSFDFTPEYNTQNVQVWANAISETLNAFSIKFLINGEIYNINQKVEALENLEEDVTNIKDDLYLQNTNASGIVLKDQFNVIGTDVISLIANNKYKIKVTTSNGETIPFFYNGNTDYEHSMYLSSGVEYDFIPTVSNNGLCFWGLAANDGSTITAVLTSGESTAIIPRLERAEKITIPLSEDFLSISLFTKIGICGDSYSKGVVETPSYWSDEVSWGKILGRMAGVDVSLFSDGGVNTRTYQTDEICLPRLLSSAKQQLYFLNLGINDYGAEIPLGTIEDIHDEDYTLNADTYYGNYGKIIQQIKNYAPNAKLIICKVLQPRFGGAGYDYSSTAIETIASHYGIPFIETKDSEFLMSDWYLNNIGGTHPTAIEYSGIAKALAQLIEIAMAKYVSYFNNYNPQTT